MVHRFLETRGRIHEAAATRASDIMRHLQARQHLGGALVVCEDPDAMLTLAQKQWLKLSRALQRRRGAVTNAVEILKYTYTITQMQHLVFSVKPLADQPGTIVHFRRADELGWLPANCFSVYLAQTMASDKLGELVAQLPASSLLVDYNGQVTPGDFGLQPKATAEATVLKSWQTMQAFMAQQGVSMKLLARTQKQSERMDDALDAVLGNEEEFLAKTRAFQRVLDVARPLRTISKDQRQQFEVLLILAHRVQTLAPGGFSAQFLNTYADDAFFLNDRTVGRLAWAELLERHQRAGRVNLVRALLQQGSAWGWRSAANERQTALAWAA